MYRARVLEQSAEPRGEHAPLAAAVPCPGRCLGPADHDGAETAPSVDELRKRVTELEAENERLRQQVKALQDLLAESA